MSGKARKGEVTAPPAPIYAPLSVKQCEILNRVIQLTLCAVKEPKKFKALYAELYPHDTDGGGTWLNMECQQLQDVIHHSRYFAAELERWESLRAQKQGETAYWAYNEDNPIPAMQESPTLMHDPVSNLVPKEKSKKYREIEEAGQNDLGFD